MTFISDGLLDMCPVCYSKLISFVQKYDSKNKGFALCNIVSCDKCNMVFVSPMPSDDFLESYNEDYFRNAHGGVAEDRLTIAFHSAINLLRVIYVEDNLTKNDRPIKTVLEVGPGQGHFAKHWLQRNPDTSSYIAIDSDKTGYDTLSEIGVKTYENFSHIPASHSFDLVVISHVLEHTAKPDQFLKICTEKLVEGGILFVEVPCSDYKHKKTVEPHLLFFDKAPMAILLEKLGYQINKISYHGKKITDLQKPVSLYNTWYGKARNFLCRNGIVFPYAIKESGLENMQNMLERAMIKPFMAHKEQITPAWWLRVIAQKK